MGKCVELWRNYAGGARRELLEHFIILYEKTYGVVNIQNESFKIRERIIGYRFMGGISIIKYTIGFGNEESFESASSLRAQGREWVLKSPEVLIEFRNQSTKTIKYAHFITYFVDRVGNVFHYVLAGDEITKYTGPLEPNEVDKVVASGRINDDHMTTSDIRISGVKIEYMDGTRESYSYDGIYLEYKEKEIVEKLKQIDFYGENCKAEIKSLLAWVEICGVDKKQLKALFDEILKSIEREKLEVDGCLYKSIGDAVSADEEIHQIMDLIKKTSGNDVAGIKKIKDQLAESIIESKNKYIEYLDKQLVEEDIRYRTVKEIEFDSRENADIARSEAEKFNVITKSIKDKNTISDLYEQVNSLQTDEWRERLAKYLDNAKGIIDAQDTLAVNTVEKDYEKIGDLVAALCPLLLLDYKAKKLNVINSDWYAMYKILRDKLCIVNGSVIDDPEEAIKAQYKWIEHAKGYYKYKNEKANQSGFLSKLKTGITGVVYKNYEAEYLSLTKNETIPLPNDGAENKSKTLEYFLMNYYSEVEIFNIYFDKYVKFINKTTNIATCEMNVSDLYIRKEKIDQSYINSVLARMFPSINRT